MVEDKPSKADYLAEQQKKTVIPKWKHGDWFYNWQGNGMLSSVKRPDGTEISFEYDALGRRTAKINEATKEITRFVWDGNVPLHEWKYNLSDRPQIVANELGELSLDKKESTENLVTWVFDEGSFVPSAKITKDDTFSIVSDYLGTPCLMYNSVGNLVWQADLDIYGKVRTLSKGNINDCPFRYQGQYHDTETELYYNRFRYYSPESGSYLSQDPIRIKSGQMNFYSYVIDTNLFIDIFGLQGGGSYYKVRSTNAGGQVHHMPANSINGLSHGSGPSIWMTTADHQMTASHGWQGSNGALYRARQQALINQGNFAGAIEMDIDDIQSLFGNTYNQNMVEMIEYAEDKGHITSAESQNLKTKCP